MIRVVIVVLALIAGTLLLGAYLSPDDLRACSSTPTNENGECMKADAIVAVSGGDTEGRTRTAVDLFQKGWADKIIFSGAAADKTGPSNAAVMRNIAIEAGVPATAILIDDVSNNTRENADQTMSLIESQGIETIILTTSPYHQRRASIEFSRAAMGQVEIINHPSSEDKHWQTFWWITPNGWRLATGELGRIITVHLGIGA